MSFWNTTDSELLKKEEKSHLSLTATNKIIDIQLKPVPVFLLYITSTALLHT